MTVPPLTCPHCGSSRLHPRRSPWAKLFLGFLAPRRLIECRNCHTIYDPRAAGEDRRGDTVSRRI